MPRAFRDFARPRCRGRRASRRDRRRSRSARRRRCARRRRTISGEGGRRDRGRARRRPPCPGFGRRSGSTSRAPRAARRRPRPSRGSPFVRVARVDDALREAMGGEHNGRAGAICRSRECERLVDDLDARVQERGLEPVARHAATSRPSGSAEARDRRRDRREPIAARAAARRPARRRPSFISRSTSRRRRRPEPPREPDPHAVEAAPRARAPARPRCASAASHRPRGIAGSPRPTTSRGAAMTVANVPEKCGQVVEGIDRSVAGRQDGGAHAANVSRRSAGDADSPSATAKARSHAIDRAAGAYRLSSARHETMQHCPRRRSRVVAPPPSTALA